MADEFNLGRSSLLPVRSLLLTVNWLGLLHLRLKFGLVFLLTVEKPVWSFSLTAPLRLEIGLSAVKQRGREKKGPPDIAPKSFSQKGPKWCSVPSIGVIEKSALEIGQFLRRNFWMISGGPFLSRPLCFTAEIGLLHLRFPHRELKDEP